MGGHQTSESISVQEPEVHRGKHVRWALLQQVRQPLCAVRAETPSAAERHVARALGPHTAQHPHVPVRAHLPYGLA